MNALVAIVPVLVGVLVALERSQPWREEVGPDVGRSRKCQHPERDVPQLIEDGLAAPGSQAQRSEPSTKLSTTTA